MSSGESKKGQAAPLRRKTVRQAVEALLRWREVFPRVFQLDHKGTGYWKGTDGWYASRAGEEDIKGPFKVPDRAKAWAEVPTRQRLAQEVVHLEAKAKERAANDPTWLGLPKEERHLRAGQIWGRRASRFQTHELLLVRRRKGDQWVCRTRIRPSTAWTSKEVIKNGATLTIAYRLLKQADSEG